MTESVASERHGASARILKTTAIIGGSNAVSTVIRIARTKIFALCLGPAGMGLMGLYNSILTTGTAVSGMGIGASGVRQVAEASGDPYRLAVAGRSLRWLSLILGAIGALVLALFSAPISHRALGTYKYAFGLAVLSFGIFLQIAADSQMALLNGLRRVRDLALINIAGSLVGTIAAASIIWLKGERGTVLAILLPIASTLACSWWACKKVSLPVIRVPWSDLKPQLWAMLRLGTAFMATGVMMTGTGLIIKLILVGRIGLTAAGLLQAAWGVAVVNVDFILNAMGIDFYPHLTASLTQTPTAGDHLVNEQTEIALLLGIPLIIGMLAFAEPLIHLLFSAKFDHAQGLLRWFVLGSIFKLAAWPMSYLILARGWAVAYFASELVWCSSYVGITYAGCQLWGLEAAGYAFVAAYAIYGLVVYLIVRQRGGFRCDRRNIAMIVGAFIAGAMLLWLRSKSGEVYYFAGAIMVLVCAGFSAKRLYNKADNPTAKRVGLAIRRTLRLSAA